MMHKYLFTNDLRISELDMALSEAVQAVQDPNLWDSKSTGNNTSTLAFYFNLYEGSNCLKEAESSITNVIRNFVIKFQFPNTRTSDSLNDVIKGGYRIAPLRELVNLLMYQTFDARDYSSYITKDEFLYYIMCQPERYMHEHTDYHSIIEEIHEARLQNKNLADLISANIIWKQYDRQARELMNILPFASKCFQAGKGRISLILPDDKDENTVDTNRFLFNVVHYNKFWMPENKDFSVAHQSYVSYMDIGGNTENINVGENPQPEKTDVELNATQLSYLTAIRTKPFLLLAGISGTGKSRIVRKLAQATDDIDFAEDFNGEARWKLHSPANFCLIQVKPNWHNSMDVVGFKSNIGKEGEHYEYTPFLEFVAKAWKHQDTPFFLCLDEMNLAPVEEYFAEFLSAIESRSIGDGDQYETDAIVKPFKDFGDKVAFEMISHLIGETYTEANDDMSPLAQRLYYKGMTLPKNLIVMGTVNMDETTFSFSRKVLDRAMSIEMNEVSYDDFLSGKTEEDIPLLTDCNMLLVERPTKAQEVKSTIDSKAVIDYLKAVNAILENTPFKLGYRAANEAILYASAGKMFGNDNIGSALDDFTLMKILSRIEGDDSKLKTKEGEDLLPKLLELLNQQFGEDGETKSQTKLNQMIEILKRDHFVSFWG